jgi:PEP-CTERM motif
MTLKTVASIVNLVIAILLGTSASARADFITNGNFETTTGGLANQTAGQLDYTSSTVSGAPVFNVSGWTTTGYNFLMNSGTPTSTGQYGSLSLWDGSNGSTDKQNTWNGTSPGGGNYIAADGDYDTAAISQNMLNLTVGKMYAVSFWWAGAQQTGYTTATTDQWQVSLGSQTQTTSVYSNPGEGFSGWSYVTMNFTATATSEMLSFLAIGTPSGVPPFALLDGVTMNVAVPEPSSLLLMGLGLLGFGVVRRRRRSKTPVA